MTPLPKSLLTQINAYKKGHKVLDAVVEKEESVTVTYEKVLSGTAKAVLTRFPGKRDIWLPKSQIKCGKEKNTFIMPKWLAKTKELL